MSIKYDKLFKLMSEKGVTQYQLRQSGVSASTINKIKNGEGGLDHRSINKICKLLNCQPGDIMEYVDD